MNARITRSYIAICAYRALLATKVSFELSKYFDHKFNLGQPVI